MDSRRPQGDCGCVKLHAKFPTALAFCLCLLQGAVEARPVAHPFAETSGIVYKDLVHTFVNAHTASGFKLKQKKQQGFTTILAFEYVFAGRPAKERGVAEFRIINREGGSRCTPCELYNVGWGLPKQDYGSAADDALANEIDVQVAKARQSLMAALGDKVRIPENMPPHPSLMLRGRAN